MAMSRKPETSREGTPLLGREIKHEASSSITLPMYSSDEEELPATSDVVGGGSLPAIVDIEIQEPIKDRHTNKKSKGVWSKVDTTAVQFALRMGILLWFSSLFVLIRTEKYQWPDGMWVLVTVLFVSWFPQLDAASVIEKIVQRLLGTFLGAFFGLACGFVSLVITDHHLTQSIFLGTCVFVFNFLIIFLAGQMKVGRVKVIKQFAYATILCVLTFCICILPFSGNEDPKYGRAVSRVFNVVIGCFVGGLGSILIVPKSTTDVLYSKASRQVTMAGEAAEAVLIVSADFFAGRIEVSRLADELLNTPLESELRWKLARSSSSLSSRSTVDAGATDVALKKYEDAIADWRLSKMLFPLVKYDPFKLFRRINVEEDVNDAFHTEIARTLARCLRIQTTIVVVDGMVRSDADYEFTSQQLESFSQTGTLIRRMLTLPLDRNASNAAATVLFQKLEETRQAVHRMSIAVADAENLSDPERNEGLKEFQMKLLSNQSFVETVRTADGDEMGRGIPINATGRDDNTLFFLQLIEHLILRSLRLYQAWTHVESIRRDKK